VTLTPEHDKVEALRAVNPTAGNLAFVLLDSEQWTVSNHAVSPGIDIPVQTIVADLLGIDLAAYQEERRQAFGLSRADASIAASIHTWSDTEPAKLHVAKPTEPANLAAVGEPGLFPVSFETPSSAEAWAVEDQERTAVAETEQVFEPVAEVTAAEAALIASIAEDSDVETETGADVDAGADADADASEDATLPPLPSIFDVPVLAPVPHLTDLDEDADVDDEDTTSVPKPAIIETGTYSLLDEEPSDTPKL
jgi:hypothetical protein